MTSQKHSHYTNHSRGDTDEERLWAKVTVIFRYQIGKPIKPEFLAYISLYSSQCMDWFLVCSWFSIVNCGMNFEFWGRVDLFAERQDLESIS